MANLLVVTGNTALKAAWSEGTVLGKTFRYQGEKMLEYLLSLMEKEKPERVKLKCPFCGYEMPVYLAPDAKCAGVFVRCKGRNCKKLFEIRVK